MLVEYCSGVEGHTRSFPIDSSNHSILCFKLAIVANASLLVPPTPIPNPIPEPIPISVSPPPIVLGATPHNSAYPLARVCVLGVGRGVPGELGGECEWKLGGGEEGMEGVRIEGVWMLDVVEGA